MSGNQWTGLLVGTLFASPAFADDVGEVSEPTVDRSNPPPQPTITPLPPQPLQTDLPIPSLEIERLPAKTSSEIAVQVSFGRAAYFEDVAAPTPGFGLRGAWGKNLGPWHRIGFSAVATAEGEPGVHTLLTIEPGIAWDFVGKSGFALGLTGGPSFIHTRNDATTQRSIGFALDPYAAARIGWSQTFSSVGRRLFVYLEPKIRFTETGMVPVASIVVGSGGGR